MMSRAIDLNLVEVRDLAEDDIPLLLNYWYRSPPGFIERMGVDPEKMPLEEAMEANLRLKIGSNRQSGKSNALAILYDGAAIGMHTLNPLVEGDSGVFHAHIWDARFRGKGVGVVSYRKACELFFQRFNLKRILFKTPLQNRGAIRVKEKLGIPCVGQETIGFGIIKDGTKALAYELTPEMLKISR